MSVLFLKSGLIVNVTDLYYEITIKYPGKRLRILEYVKELENAGHVFTFKIAYSQQAPGTAQNFAHLLQCHGFETHFGLNSWSLAMALRATQILPEIDTFVLGSAELNMLKLLQYAKERGKITKCFAVNIPQIFATVAECIEVPETVLHDTPRKAQQMELPRDSGSNGS